MFKKGISGCVTGRPKGIIDKRAVFRDLLTPHAPELIEKLIQQAKDGEPHAMRLVIERLIPRVKPDQGINFPMPGGRIDTGENMLEMIHNTIASVVSGQITIDEANKLTEFLTSQRRLIERAEYKQEDDERKKNRGY
jgi:hypothetical protein